MRHVRFCLLIDNFFKGLITSDDALFLLALVLLRASQILSDVSNGVLLTLMRESHFLIRRCSLSESDWISDVVPSSDMALA